MKKNSTITARINQKALELLEANPGGLQWTELAKGIKASDPALHPKTINGCIWRLPARFSDQVYKPSRGLFRLTKYR